jgi:hypothetical protein
VAVHLVVKRWRYTSVDRELVDSQAAKRRLGGWCEMAASLAIVS